MENNKEITLDDLALIVKDGFDSVDNRFNGIETRLGGVESRLNKIEATMVTKNYLDNKLADLKGYLVSSIKNVNLKVDLLIDVAQIKEGANSDTVKQMKSITVFPSVN